MPKVYEDIAAALARLHAGPVFGLMGDGNLKFVSALKYQHGTAYHAARHENAAVAMADGWARVAARPGVCSVTQGPGLTNALTALVEAHKAGTPMVALIGDTPRDQPWHNQNVDQRAVTESLGIPYASLENPVGVGAQLSEAFALAQRRGGPVVVGVPTDLQELESQPTSFDLPQEVPRSVAAGEAVRRVADLVAAAKRPVVLAGRGAVNSGAQDVLTRLADRLGALTATSAVAKAFFGERSLDVGIAGGFSSPLAVQLLSQADLVLGFGVSFTHWTTRMGTLFASATVVQCEHDPAVVGSNGAIDVALIGDARETAAALLAELERRELDVAGWGDTDVAEQISAQRDAGRDTLTPPDKQVDGETLVHSIDALLPAEKHVVVDSGHFMGYPAMHMKVSRERQFIFAQDFQSVGLGLATALGVAIAEPDVFTVAVVGDGGLMMSLGELDTAVRVGLPLLIVVMNDAAYGAEYHLLSRFGFPVEGSRFPDSDFAAIAEAVGARGATVARYRDLAAVNGWLDDPSGPFLLDCKIDPSVMAGWFEEIFALRERSAATTGVSASR